MGRMIFISALLICLSMSSAATTYKFWVQLTDKENNNYSLDNPGEFLSQRSIERRARQGIPITVEDLPVTSAYIDSLGKFPLKVLYTSK